MSEDQDVFYNLTKRIEDIFPEIDSDICMDLLHNNSEYAFLQQEVKGIKEKHPVIEDVLLGDGEISLSADEHGAFVRYIALSMQMENMERLQAYFTGHKDGYAYLKRIGVL